MTPTQAAMDTIVSLCEVINGYLLDDRYHSIRLEPRGQSLCLRAKLPSKESGGKPSMQRISLGVKADKHGLKKALWKAREIQVKLITNSFQWRDYDPTYHNTETIEKSLVQFKESFFNEPKRKLNLNATNVTWKGAYVPYLNRLKKIQQEHQLPLNVELVRLVLESYDLSSSGRQKCGIVLKKLAEQEKIKLPENWKELSGGHQSLEKEKLKYPSDQEIVELWNKIKNPRWK